jgi:hypothetical protein
MKPKRYIFTHEFLQRAVIIMARLIDVYDAIAESIAIGWNPFVVTP